MSDVLFVSVAEAARRLGISRAQAYKEVASGRIPSERFGARQGLRVPVVALERLAEQAARRAS